MELTVAGLDGTLVELQVAQCDRVGDLRPQVAAAFGLMGSFACDLTCANRLLLDTDALSQLPTCSLQVVKKPWSRDMLVFLARVAEQAERYDEMVMYMEAVAKLPEALSGEERNLLSVAYKNAVGSRRAAWRIATSVLQKAETAGNEAEAKYAKQYAGNIEAELQGICNSACRLLDEHLMSKAETVESKGFYQKARADYYRYMSEISDGEAKSTTAEKARAAYRDAHRMAAQDLPATHPTRLGLALSTAVWTYEVLGNPEEAVEIARAAFECAVAELDTVPEDTYRDSTLIMQLLSDNLAQWTSPDAQPERASG